jgi:hypothetical protein
MSQPEGRPGVDEHGISGAGHGERGGEAGAAAAGRPPGFGVGGEGGEGAGSAGARDQASQGQAAGVQQPPSPGELTRERSPLYHAQHAPRYQRQQLIRDYQAAYDCRLIVMIGPIFGYSIEYFEELLYDAAPDQNLHLMLVSPGGDGEVAVRLVRMAQARCAHMTVIVPDEAKSAATLLALGAHEILMGPTSDLGPVDPQFPVGDFDLVSAKDMIAAVERALDDVAQRPDTYPLHASLLADVGALKVEQARSALARTDDLVREALSSNPDRGNDEVDELVQRLHEPLIGHRKSTRRSLAPGTRRNSASPSPSATLRQTSGGASGGYGCTITCSDPLRSTRTSTSLRSRHPSEAPKEDFQTIDAYRAARRSSRHGAPSGSSDGAWHSPP